MNSVETTPDVLEGYLILLVDDAVDNLEVLQEVLELNGARVITARNGREGAEMAKHRPDLIITDLAMPLMSGYEMLAAIQDDRSMVEIPVIALTGHALDEYRTAAFAAGCRNFLIKPVSPSILLREVLDILARPSPA